MECTKANEQLRSYCPNIYTVLLHPLHCAIHSVKDCKVKPLDGFVTVAMTRKLSLSSCIMCILVQLDTRPIETDLKPEETQRASQFQTSSATTKGGHTLGPRSSKNRTLRSILLLFT